MEDVPDELIYIGESFMRIPVGILRDEAVRIIHIWTNEADSCMNECPGISQFVMEPRCFPPKTLVISMFENRNIKVSSLAPDEDLVVR